MAEGLQAFFQAPQGDVSLDEILSVLQTYDQDRNRLPEDVAATVNAIVNISCKSICSIRRVFAFLKLPDPTKEVLRKDRIGVSQGHLFADYLDNPELIQIFNGLLTASRISYEFLLYTPVLG